MTHEDHKFLEIAYELAKESFNDGGLPIGAVLVRGGEIIGRGHNQRIQQGDPIAHAEMDCMKDAGRQKSYRDTTMYTTLSPCLMCAGTIVQFGIPRVVIGENENFGGNEDFLREKGVQVVLVNHQGCIALMNKMIDERQDDWLEDIGEEHR
jgi:creatinine deaminase